jgi:hypothetical protein
MIKLNVTPRKNSFAVRAFYRLVSLWFPFKITLKTPGYPDLYAYLFYLRYDFHHIITPSSSTSSSM